MSNNLFSGLVVLLGYYFNIFDFKRIELSLRYYIIDNNLQILDISEGWYYFCM